MSEAWFENVDTESAEYDGREGAERYDESEGESYDAEARGDRARRERARRIALARQRAQARRGGARPSPGLSSQRTPGQAAVNAVRTLDLETKVQEDSFRRAIGLQGKRMSRSEYVAVASAATNQFIESFDAPDNPFFRAALRFAPLLLLSPQPRGTGLETFIKDPRVVGGVAVAGIVLVGENRKRFTASRNIAIVGPSAMKVASPNDQFFADVSDGRGVVIPSKVTWSSSDPTVATIDPDSGKITALKAGPVTVTAKADGVERRFRVDVS